MYLLLLDDDEEEDDVGNVNGNDLIMMEIVVFYLFRSITSFIPIIE